MNPMSGCRARTSWTSVDPDRPLLMMNANTPAPALRNVRSALISHCCLDRPVLVPDQSFWRDRKIGEVGAEDHRHHLGAVVRFEFAQDRLHMGLDGLLGDAEPSRDAAVVEAVHDLRQHLTLARAQAAGAGRRAAAGSWWPERQRRGAGAAEARIKRHRPPR